MSGIKSKLGAILTNKCPACREGDFFVSKNPYNFEKFGKMHETCPKCGQKYTIEPGFYFGAAYVSYGLNVALFVAAVIIIYLFVEEPSITNYVLRHNSSNHCFGTNIVSIIKTNMGSNVHPF